MEQVITHLLKENKALKSTWHSIKTSKRNEEKWKESLKTMLDSLMTTQAEYMRQLNAKRLKKVAMCYKWKTLEETI